MDIAQQFKGQAQSHTVDISSVPWLIGEEWNMDLDQLRGWWELGKIPQVAATERPTQVHGRNLEWFVGFR